MNGDAMVAAALGGGTLAVTAKAGGNSATATLTITGTNPTQQQVQAFLATQPHGADFAKILLAESGASNFRNGEPIKSFDNGYGMCQLTTPAPTFVQVWKWQSNVLGGLELFAGKRAIATSYLTQGGRTCTDTQLLYETVSLWNGGHYHVWNGTAWVRNANVLCDRLAGNIGWDMTLPVNAGKTEQALHQRDSAGYKAGHVATSHWQYFGVCYADHILG